MTLNVSALAVLIAFVGAGSALAASTTQPPAPDVIAPAAPPALHPLLAAAAPVAAPASALQAAPMPDPDVNAPAAGDKTTRVRPTLYVEKTHYAGDGYAPGSDDHERAIQPAAGVAVDVPIN